MASVRLLPSLRATIAQHSNELQSIKLCVGNLTSICDCQQSESGCSRCRTVNCSCNHPAEVSSPAPVKANYDETGSSNYTEVNDAATTSGTQPLSSCQSSPAAPLAQPLSGQACSSRAHCRRAVRTPAGFRIRNQLSRGAVGSSSRAMAHGMLQQYSSNAGPGSKRELLAGQPIHETHPTLLKPGELAPGISAAEFQQRRQALARALPPNSVAILPSANIIFMAGGCRLQSFWL